MTKQIDVQIPEKLAVIFDGPADYRGAYGGRGAAKTIGFADMAIVDIMQPSPKPWKFLCGRELQKSLKDSVFSVIESQIRTLGVEDAFDVGKEYIRCKNGNEFLFYGLRTNIAEVKGLHGVRRTWLEEAQKVSQSSLNYLVPTVMRDFPDCEMWASWNPDAEDDPIHKMYVEDADATFKVTKINWYDNPFFPESLNKVRLRDKLNNPNLYEWIWEGSFNNSADGAIFAKQLEAARLDGRITKVPYDPGHEVFHAWDLGWGDATAIWWLQWVGRELRWIDFYENSGEQLDHYAKMVKSKPYNYMARGCFLPHDGGHGNIRGDSVSKQLTDLGVPNQVLVRETDITPGIELMRQTIAFSVFDEVKCKEGLRALKKYGYDWDEDRQRFKSKPRHDWASDAASAARYGAIAAGKVRAEMGGTTGQAAPVHKFRTNNAYMG